MMGRYIQERYTLDELLEQDRRWNAAQRANRLTIDELLEQEDERNNAMLDAIIWTKSLRDAARAIADDTEFTPPYWGDTWQSVRDRAREIADHCPLYQPLEYRADAITAMRSRAHGFHPRPATFAAFESLWAEAYDAAKSGDKA
jgi:hypothetical protein